MELNIFAMPPSTILLLLSAAFGMTSALPWSGPIPTSVYKADEWSPRPTNTPTNPRDLFKRAQADVAVCGWVGGNEKNPAVCPAGSSCIHDMAHGYVGCCTTSGKCTAGVYTGCIDKNSPGGNTGPPVENNGIYTCQGDSLCYLNSYPLSYSQWGCGKTEQATTIDTTYTGQPDDFLLQIVYTRMTFSPRTLPSTTSSSSSSTSTQSSAATTTATDVKSAPVASTTVIPNPNAAGASPGATGTTSVVEEDSSKPKNKVNGGIVAAGVIGTGAFIIALLAIILFFLRRRRKQQENNSNSGGSFMAVKGGELGVQAAAPASPASTQATFPRAVAYSPDDFRTMASTSAASPAMDPTRSIYAPEEYQGIEQRMRENANLAVPPQPYYQSPSLDGDGLPKVSEIDNFSHSFHAAIAQMSPPTPPQAQMSNVVPPASQGYSSQAPEGAAGIAMGAVAGAARRDSRSHGAHGYGPVEDDDYGQQDSYMPGDDYGRVLADNYAPPDEYEDEFVEDDYSGTIDPYDPTNKEMGMATTVRAPPSYSPVPGFRSENVRREGWEPQGLQPNRDMTPSPQRVERVSDGTPRYQLVDQPPVGGVPVLHSPGQLRGQNKGARQKQGYDGKNGDDLQA